MLAAVAVFTAIAWLCNDVRRASRTLGIIVACGLLLRIGLGLTLFWLVETDAPFLRSLRTPDGIWRFALDSAGYLHDASLAAGSGHIAPSAGFSPDYAAWLSAWMRLLGTSPVTAPLLNLTLFAIVCWLVVRTAAPTGRDADDVPQLVAVGSFAFSPALLLHGSQALKDDLCAALIAIACVGALRLFAPEPEAGGRLRRRATGLLTMLAACYLLFGLRNYAVGLIGGATAVGATLPWACRRSSWRATARAGAAVLACVVLAVALWLGAAGSTVAARAESGRLLAVKAGSKALGAPDALRHGFHKTGGNTNLVPGPVPAWRTPVPSLTVTQRARALLTGLAAIFVPITLLQATGAVELGIGRGLRLATDIDTIFLDASIAAALLLLGRRQAAARCHLRYVRFALALGIATTILMAYIVTNFGTLFRLRVMLAVPIWMLGVAVACEPLPSVQRVQDAEFTPNVEGT